MSDRSDLSSEPERLTEAEWRARESLRQHWHAFCDADPVPEDFIDDMEAAGFAQLRKVTRDDLEDSFASERGIYKGGQVWDLTDLGRKVFEALTAQESSHVG